MKKNAKPRKPAEEASTKQEDQPQNIHQIRKRIEDILLERDQKERIEL